MRATPRAILKSVSPIIRPYNLLFLFLLFVLSLGLSIGSPGGWGLKDITRWDWLSLLGAPILLAVFGSWLQQLQKDREKKQEADKILSGYIDQLSSLLIEKDILAASDAAKDGARRVLRTRTLAALRQLKSDSERKGLVIRYLSETGLLSALKIDLSGADLEEASLDGVDLRGAILTGARLANSKLRGANLADCNLSSFDAMEDIRNNTNITKRCIDELDGRNPPADLSGADLRKAYLVKSDLRKVCLEGADLRGAILGINPLGGPIENGAKLAGASLKSVQWDGETMWPNKQEFTNVKNIPACLKRKLDLQ